MPSLDPCGYGVQLSCSCSAQIGLVVDACCARSFKVPGTKDNPFFFFFSKAQYDTCKDRCFLQCMDFVAFSVRKLWQRVWITKQCRLSVVRGSSRDQLLDQGGAILNPLPFSPSLTWGTESTRSPSDAGETFSLSCLFLPQIKSKPAPIKFKILSSSLLIKSCTC